MICEVCEEELGPLRLDLGLHPLCDDLIPTNSDSRTANFHQLIGLCSNCMTAHQLKPIQKELLFKPSYHYRAGLTKDVLNGMRDLVNSLSNEFLNLDRPGTILDIGCNDGSLLKIFKETFECTTIGVDPTNAILESGSNIDFKFHAYFSERVAVSIKNTNPVIDIITFTNVFAHIEDLRSLIRSIKVLISENTTLVIENHYLGSILERNQFDTFYHEHPRTYSLKSFQFIAKSLDLIITSVEFPSRYGGNIRITMKRNGIEEDLSAYSAKENLFIDQFRGLQATYDSWKQQGKYFLSQFNERAQIYGKSLPGRAVMLINSLKIDPNVMPAIFEQPISPKVGNYVPGSRIPIISDEELKIVNPGHLLIWSWHIIEEITSYLDELGYRGEIWTPLPEFNLYRAAK